MTVTVDANTCILGIETSCDETAAAVVVGGTNVLSSVVSSQVDLHARFGGVVPEIAGRAHVEMLTPVIAQAIVEAGIDDDRIDTVAATVGPGLVGSLLVGVSAAKALALVWDVPFVAVNHLEAHLYAALLEEPELQLRWWCCSCRVGTRCSSRCRTTGVPAPRTDDRRCSRRGVRQGRRFLGLGYPGGPAIDRIAMSGDPTAIASRPAAAARQGQNGHRRASRTRASSWRSRPPSGRAAPRSAGRRAAVARRGRRRFRRYRSRACWAPGKAWARCAHGFAAATSAASGSMPAARSRAQVRISGRPINAVGSLESTLSTKRDAERFDLGAAGAVVRRFGAQVALDLAIAQVAKVHGHRHPLGSAKAARAADHRDRGVKDHRATAHRDQLGPGALEQYVGCACSSRQFRYCSSAPGPAGRDARAHGAVSHRGGRALRGERLHTLTSVATVTVQFGNLGDEEIERYLRTREAVRLRRQRQDGSPGHTLRRCHRELRDDPTALIGLPLIRTCALLREAGLDPLAAEVAAAKP